MMIYEKATGVDIEMLTKLRLAYLAEDNDGLSETDVEIIEKKLPGYFERNLNNNIFAYVARNENDIVACALLLLVEKPMSPSFINGKTGTVLNVYTKPEFRGMGHARKVMELLMSDAIANELSVVELKATEEGYFLYKSVGFRDDNSKYHAMKWSNK